MKDFMPGNVIPVISSAKTHYQALMIREFSTIEDARKNFKLLAKLIHPDKCKIRGAAEAFSRIKEAYDFLSDPEKKKNYDVNMSYSHVGNPQYWDTFVRNRPGGNSHFSFDNYSWMNAGGPSMPEPRVKHYWQRVYQQSDTRAKYYSPRAPHPFHQHESPGFARTPHYHGAHTNEKPRKESKKRTHESQQAKPSPAAASSDNPFYGMSSLRILEVVSDAFKKTPNGASSSKSGKQTRQTGSVHVGSGPLPQREGIYTHQRGAQSSFDPSPADGEGKRSSKWKLPNDHRRGSTSSQEKNKEQSQQKDGPITENANENPLGGLYNGEGDTPGPKIKDYDQNSKPFADSNSTGGKAEDHKSSAHIHDEKERKKSPMRSKNTTEPFRFVDETETTGKEKDIKTGEGRRLRHGDRETPTAEKKQGDHVRQESPPSSSSTQRPTQYSKSTPPWIKDFKPSSLRRRKFSEERTKLDNAHTPISNSQKEAAGIKSDVNEEKSEYKGKNQQNTVHLGSKPLNMTAATLLTGKKPKSEVLLEASMPFPPRKGHSDTKTSENIQQSWRESFGKEAPETEFVEKEQRVRFKLGADGRGGPLKNMYLTPKTGKPREYVHQNHPLKARKPSEIDRPYRRSVDDFIHKSGGTPQNSRMGTKNKEQSRSPAVESSNKKEVHLKSDQPIKIDVETNWERRAHSTSDSLRFERAEIEKTSRELHDVIKKILAVDQRDGKSKKRRKSEYYLRKKQFFDSRNSAEPIFVGERDDIDIELDSKRLNRTETRARSKKRHKSHGGKTSSETGDFGGFSSPDGETVAYVLIEDISSD